MTDGTMTMEQAASLQHFNRYDPEAWENSVSVYEPAYSLGFVFNTMQTHVLLLRKARPAWQAGKLNGIVGHIEPGELPIDAMVREFAEEAGVRTILRDWNLFAVMDGGDAQAGQPQNTAAVYCYEATDDHIFSYARAKTDEPIDRYAIGALFFRPDLVVNLPVLIPLALHRGIFQRPTHLPWSQETLAAAKN